MKIKFVGEASPLVTEKRIRTEVKRLLNADRDHEFTPEWVEAVDVREGTEKCGYGPLHITGYVQHWNGSGFVMHNLRDAGSEWHNYGSPHGTRHHVDIELTRV